jgi:O-antigen/teichoic acid export membrane protein
MEIFVRGATLSEATGIYQKFTKDILTVGIAQLLLSLRGLILLPLIAGVLGAAAYGVWAQAHITLSLIGTFASLGMGFAFIRFFAGETDNARTRQGFFSILFAEFGWSCLLAVVLYIVATPVAEVLFGGPESVSVVQLCAAILPFYMMNFHFLFFFRAFREMKRFAVMQISLSLGELALVFVMVLSGRGVLGALLGMLTAYALFDMVMLFMVVRRIGLSFPRFSSLAKMGEYLRFGLPLLPSSIVEWLVNSSDRYVIAAFLGIAVVGTYSAAYSLAAAISVYASPIAMVIVPTLAYLYDNGQIEEVRKHLTYSLKYLLLLAIPSAVGISLLSRPILQVLTDAEFASAGPKVVPFVAAAMVLHSCQSVVAQPILLAKKTHIIGLAWGAAAALNLGLNLLLVPRFGIIAAASTTLLAFMAGTAWISYYSLKYLRFRIEWGFMVKSVLASAVMSGIILLFHPYNGIDLLVVIPVGAVVYFLVLFFVGGIRRQETAFFLRLAVSMIPFRRAGQPGVPT